MASQTRHDFVCIRARVDPERVGRLVAELSDAGLSGLEERESEDGLMLLLYAPRARARAVVHLARRCLGDPGAVDEPEGVAPREWTTEWKQGLGAVRVSSRLRIRPPFVTAALEPGQREVVIDPGQAFGTGGHASTHLALTLLDRVLARRQQPVERMLDVGTGSGVLALAALALGAHRVVACDLDPVAASEACRNAGENQLSRGLAPFAGSLFALREDARFDPIVANLLRSELLPLLSALAARLPSDGTLVLSGLLAVERSAIEAELARHGLRVEEAEDAVDERGARWLGLTTRPAGGPANRPGPA